MNVRFVWFSASLFYIHHQQCTPLMVVNTVNVQQVSSLKQMNT